MLGGHQQVRIRPHSSELQNGQVTTYFGGDFTCGSHSESVCNSLSYDLFIVGALLGFTAPDAWIDLVFFTSTVRMSSKPLQRFMPNFLIKNIIAPPTND